MAESDDERLGLLGELQLLSATLGNAERPEPEQGDIPVLLDVVEVVLVLEVVEVVPWTGWVVEVVVVEPFPPDAAAIPTPAPATATAPRATGAAPIPPAAANPAGTAGKTWTEAFERYAAIGLSLHSCSLPTTIGLYSEVRASLKLRSLTCR